MQPNTNIDAALQLAGAGFVLRAYLPADAPLLLEAVRESIAEVGRWLPWCHAGYCLADAENWLRDCAANWRSGSAYQLTLVAADGQCLLGAVGINHINRVNRIANMGYWIRTGSCGHGLASQAARLAAQFAFSQLGISRIEIAAMPDNIASRRVAEKCGAKFECIARNRIVMRGRAYPAASYALLPEDLNVC
jgi:ribosomal-protein-serine acetyltransferase